MNIEAIRGKLVNLADEKLKIFSEKLIFQPQILGVRTPQIKNLAKNLALSPENIDLYEPFYHEEFCLKGFCIINLKNDADKFSCASKFVKTMPNWAVCDQFDAVKFKDVAFAKKLLNQCLRSNLEYERRFFYVYFMRMLAGFTLSEFFEICARERDERYYVKMAVAWAISEIFIKFPSDTREFLASRRLDGWIQNKTIQKIRESRRVAKDVKDELERLKFKSANRLKITKMRSRGENV